MKSLIVLALLSCVLLISCDNKSNGIVNSDNPKQSDVESQKKDGAKVKVIEDENSLVNKVIILTDPYEFAERIEDDGLLVDVRTADEFNAGHIAGAINIDFLSEDFTSKIDELDKINPINIYCQSGGRSGNAAIQMKKLGFKKIYDLEGGYSKYKELGL